MYSCEENSIKKIPDYSYALPEENKYKYGEREYGFKTSGIYPKETDVAFLIKCISPETKKPTANFILQLMGNKNDMKTVFYQSIGGSTTMLHLSNLTAIVSTKYYAWLDRENTFIFSLNRANSTPYSVYINFITIELPFNLKLVSCTVCSAVITNTVGITFDPSISCTCDGSPTSTIRIESIKHLEHSLSFSISRILSPSSTHGDNAINITRSQNRGAGIYDSEKGSTNSIRFSCNYPCKECSSPLNNCTECLSKNDQMFEGETSLHLLYTGDVGTCLNTCPEHTYETNSSCSDCVNSCHSCSIVNYNCTQCYNNTFLLNGECLDHCDSPYIEDSQNWICYAMLGFVVGSYIEILDDEKEIEKAANYSFCLRPEEGLVEEAVIEITAPNTLFVKSVCECPPGTCTVAGHVLTLSNMLTENYISAPGGGDCLAFSIINAYANPNLTYTYSSMEFLVETKVG